MASGDGGGGEEDGATGLNAGTAGRRPLGGLNAGAVEGRHRAYCSRTGRAGLAELLDGHSPACIVALDFIGSTRHWFQ